MQAIVVNGVEIARTAIEREAQHHPAPDAQAAYDAAAQALVVRELLLQRARACGLTVERQTDESGRQETEDDALVRALIDTEVRVPTADEPSCRRYFENNPGKFRAPDLYEVAHILLAADRSDEQAYARVRDEAETLRVLITHDPQSFESIARERSDCPSSNQGGSLGQISAGQTVPEFEAALARMDEGARAPAIVESRYGVHLVRLDRKLAGKALPFEVVRERIAAWLEAASWQRAASQYVRILAGAAQITGVEFERASSPLV